MLTALLVRSLNDTQNNPKQISRLLWQLESKDEQRSTSFGSHLTSFPKISNVHLIVSNKASASIEWQYRSSRLRDGVSRTAIRSVIGQPSRRYSSTELKWVASRSRNMHPSASSSEANIPKDTTTNMLFAFRCSVETRSFLRNTFRSLFLEVFVNVKEYL